MSITLGQLKIKLNYAVGTTETKLLTTEKRTNALNYAVQTVLENYPIPQYIKSVTLTFSSGIADLPTDCLLPYKLKDTNQPNLEYEFINWDDFGNNITRTANIFFNESGSKEQIQIYPTTATSLKLWYVQLPVAMSADADAVRFNSWWAEALAQKAAEKLLMDTSAFNRGDAKKFIADDLIDKAWQIERKRLVGTVGNKINSVFAKRSLLNFRSTITTQT